MTFKHLPLHSQEENKFITKLKITHTNRVTATTHTVLQCPHAGFGRRAHNMSTWDATRAVGGDHLSLDHAPLLTVPHLLYIHFRGARGFYEGRQRMRGGDGEKDRAALVCHRAFTVTRQRQQTTTLKWSKNTVSMHSMLKSSRLREK